MNVKVTNIGFNMGHSLNSDAMVTKKSELDI